MNSLGIRQILIAGSLVVAAICTGCNRNGEGNASTVAKIVRPGPEESFKLIEETFRRRVEETPLGFVSSVGSSRSSMSGTNEVTSELIPPTGAGEKYKAIITVASRSRYSLRRTKAQEDADRNDEKAKTNLETLAEKGDASGLEILDPDLISQPGPKSKSAGAAPAAREEIVGRRPDEEVRKYELVYENERWVLVTQLDKETERSIQNAFDQALGTQF